MIRIENFVGPSPEQWQAVIRGMRNPMNSWDKSDSGMCDGIFDFPKYKNAWCQDCRFYQLNTKKEAWMCFGKEHQEEFPIFRLGLSDIHLASKLCKAGPEHRKFLRQLPVIMDITAPLYWWKQMDKYQIGTVTDSCSTMHKLLDKPFELSDFSFESLQEVEWPYEDLENRIVLELNDFIGRYFDEYDDEPKKEKIWKAIIEILPEGYNQKRTFSTNYEVLRTICHQREGHKLSEWADFVQWVRDNVPYAFDLIFWRF